MIFTHVILASGLYDQSNLAQRRVDSNTIIYVVLEINVVSFPLDGWLGPPLGSTNYLLVIPF